MLRLRNNPRENCFYTVPVCLFLTVILATVGNLIFEYSVHRRDISTGIHCTSIPKEGNREAYRNEHLCTIVLFFCLVLNSTMTLVYLHSCMAAMTLTSRVIPVTSGHLEQEEPKGHRAVPFKKGLGFSI